MYKVVERCFWIDKIKDADLIKDRETKQSEQSKKRTAEERGIGDNNEEDLMSDVILNKVGSYLDVQESRGFNLVSHILIESSFEPKEYKTYEFIFCKK